MKKTFSLIVLLLCAALTIGCTALASCTSSDKQTREQQDIATIADIPADGKVAEIVERGYIIIGTTGDYRPLSFREEDGTYWGWLRRLPTG